MNQFSLGSAWSKGISFFSNVPAGHAIILIGMGVVIPFVLQYAVAGGVMGLVNPAMMGQGGLEAITALGLGALLVMLASYILQMGSYFGSWRLGFGQGETLAGAIVYGLIAGVLVIVLFAAIILVAGLVMTQADPVVGALLMFITLLPLAALLYTLWAALIAVVMFLALLIIFAFGASISQVSPALAGASGMITLIMLVLVVIFFWLTARFSCVTAVMADRRTFNPLVGLAESWRLTAANQWRIMGYLALLSIVLMVLFVVVGMILGGGMARGMQAGAVPEVSIGMIIGSLIVGIPTAYLTVLVPAGIRRELGGEESSAKVFV